MDRLFRRGPDIGTRVDFLAGFEVLEEDIAEASAEEGVSAADLAAEADTVVGKFGKKNLIPFHRVNSLEGGVCYAWI
jgi:hypothetical protein